MSRKLCLNVQKETYIGISPEEQIREIADAGFDAFFTGWSDRVKEYRALGESLGLAYPMIHAPNGHTELLWEDRETARILLDEWSACIEGAADVGVPTVVLHPFRGIGREGVPGERGVAHFMQIATLAERCGVRIAVENCEGERYLDALLDATAGCPHVGFCWDTGHEQCYNRGTDMMRGRAHRLIATHLNDNLGVRSGGVTSKDDLHFLPFDGITDWQSVAERLKQATIPEYLIFEVKKREKYADLTPKEFIGEAYRRAHRFAAML